MKRKPSTPARAFRGGAFTLTELLIVVVIIAVLASVVIPVIMKSASAVTAKSAALERKRNAIAAADVREEATDNEGALPIIESLNLELTLSGEPQRIGLEVYNRFLFRGTGSISIKGAPDEEGPVRVIIPFPAGTIEAANVFLRTGSGGGAESRNGADDVEYRLTGIHWTPTLAPGERLEAEIGFTTLGTERLEWSLPSCRRLEAIALNLDLSDTNAPGVSSFSLTPSRIDDGKTYWEYENLVSDRQIVVSVPGAQSPSGRLLQLLRFMAVAVLMFGGGFLYMNERDCPGRLDEFRLGHFSLLAAIYSIFFIVFAVIIYREQMSVMPALVVSAISSLPLLVLHVTRLANLRFALLRILPLAVLTLAVVVNGVYGGGARDYVFLGVLVVSMAYLTMTFGTPGEKREVVMTAPTPAG